MRYNTINYHRMRGPCLAHTRCHVFVSFPPFLHCEDTCYYCIRIDNRVNAIIKQKEGRLARLKSGREEKRGEGEDSQSVLRPFNPWHPQHFHSHPWVPNAGFHDWHVKEKKKQKEWKKRRKRLFVYPILACANHLLCVLLDPSLGSLLERSLVVLVLLGNRGFNGVIWIWFH